jgi:protease-4
MLYALNHPRSLALFMGLTLATFVASQETPETEPAIPTVASLKPSGRYADLPEMGFDPTSLLTGGAGAPPKAFYPFLETIDGLAKVPQAEVLLDLSGNPGFNMPQLRELERAFGRVRAVGKKVVVYVENVGSATMQVAAMADEVLMADMGAIDLRSPAMSVMHLKDALDLLGVQVEVTRVGDFKGAVEPYMLPQISDHLRKHYEAMLSSMNADVVRQIAVGRKLDEAKVRELQAQRLISAREAQAAGLVDRLVPWSGAERAYELVRGIPDVQLVDAGPKKKKQNADLLTIFSSMMRASREEKVEDPQVVVMHLSGQIVDGDKPAAGSMVSGPAVAKLDALADDELVKAVVVRINSPGGSATASEAIRLALQRLAAKKPVVFSMGDLAASGGYWITTIGKPIFAEVGTITGSIGVFGMRFQTGPLMRRLGVHTDIVRLDDGPLMDAADRPWSEAARERMQRLVDDIYDRFLANVASSRQMTRDAVDKIAGGRVWSGRQALDLGLVDALGGVEEALAMAMEQAGVTKDDVEIVHQPQAKSFADSLLASLVDARIAAGVEPAVMRAVLARCAGFAGMVGMLTDALAGDGRARIYAQLPMGIEVR